MLIYFNLPEGRKVMWRIGEEKRVTEKEQRREERYIKGEMEMIFCLLGHTPQMPAAATDRPGWSQKPWSQCRLPTLVAGVQELGHELLSPRIHSRKLGPEPEWRSQELQLALGVEWGIPSIAYHSFTTTPAPRAGRLGTWQLACL